MQKVSFNFNLATGLQMLGLALIIGGPLALGAFTAPTVFHALPRAQAGAIMMPVFRHYDIVMLVALGLLLLGEAIRIVSTSNYKDFTGPKVIRYGVMGILTAMLGFSLFSVNPHVEELQLSGKHPTAPNVTPAEAEAFESVHHLSESLYKGELMLAVLLIFLTPFMTPKRDS